MRISDWSSDVCSSDLIASSAAVFSKAVKERWMAKFPNAVFTDSVGSSETGFQGTGLQDASALSTDGPVVTIAAGPVVIDDDGKVLDPSVDVGKVGRTAKAGYVPVGYYKDTEKAAKTRYED